MAAGARGLGGCSVGAFYDEEAARALGVNLEEHWPLHFFGLGEKAYGD
jgi:nitroreductase